MKKITIEIPEEHFEAVYLGIGMIKNLRETGDHELAGEDALRRGITVRPMTDSQMQSVLGLKAVMADMLEQRYK